MRKLTPAMSFALKDAVARPYYSLSPVIRQSTVNALRIRKLVYERTWILTELGKKVARKELKKRLVQPEPPKQWTAQQMSGDELPPKLKGWNHTERCVVWYKGNENHTDTFGIAYYHYKPPFKSKGEWIDFSGNSHGREPTYWWETPGIADTDES